MAVNMRSLQKYGANLPIHSTFRNYNNPFWLEELRRQKQKEQISTAQDCQEAIDLASALDNLSKQIGNTPELKDFLYKLKVRFWHIHENSKNNIIEAIFKHGKIKYRCYLVWFLRLQNDHHWYGEKPSCHSIADPPLENWKKDRKTENWTANATGCHSSISSGELNVFVLYTMQSSRPLSKADFWGILAYQRADFLEFLLVDRPDKKLPYSITNIIQWVLESDKADFALKVLQMIERIKPGLLSSITDSHGGNLLWFLLCNTRGKPKLDRNGEIILTPLQDFLYNLCDHAKPNCDGISLDDLFRYYPAKLL